MLPPENKETMLQVILKADPKNFEQTIKKFLTSKQDIGFLCEPSVMKKLQVIFNEAIIRVQESQKYDDAKHVLLAVEHIATFIDNKGINFLLDNGLLDMILDTFSLVLDTLNASSEGCNMIYQEILEAIGAVADSGLKGKGMVLECFGARLLKLVYSKSFGFSIRNESLKSLNMLLEQCPADAKVKLKKCQDYGEILNNLADYLDTAGDYEFQAGMVECLFRLTGVSDRKYLTRQLFKGSLLVEGFLNIKDSEFEIDCRRFLLKLNNHPNSSITTIPAKKVLLGRYELRKPKDNNYDAFWIDFNHGSSRMSWFCEAEQTPSQEANILWETVSIWSDDVLKYQIDDKRDTIELVIELKCSVKQLMDVRQNSRSRTVTFHFAHGHDVKQAITNTFSNDRTILHKQKPLSDSGSYAGKTNVKECAKETPDYSKVKYSTAVDSLNTSFCNRDKTKVVPRSYPEGGDIELSMDQNIKSTVLSSNEFISKSETPSKTGRGNISCNDNTPKKADKKEMIETTQEMNYSQVSVTSGFDTVSAEKSAKTQLQEMETEDSLPHKGWQQTHEKRSNVKGGVNSDDCKAENNTYIQVTGQLKKPKQPRTEYVPPDSTSQLKKGISSDIVEVVIPEGMVISPKDYERKYVTAKKKASSLDRNKGKSLSCALQEGDINSKFKKYYSPFTRCKYITEVVETQSCPRESDDSKQDRNVVCDEAFNVISTEIMKNLAVNQGTNTIALETLSPKTSLPPGRFLRQLRRSYKVKLDDKGILQKLPNEKQQPQKLCIPDHQRNTAKKQGSHVYKALKYLNEISQLGLSKKGMMNKASKRKFFKSRTKPIICLSNDVSAAASVYEFEPDLDIEQSAKDGRKSTKRNSVRRKENVLKSASQKNTLSQTTKKSHLLRKKKRINSTEEEISDSESAVDSCVLQNNERGENNIESSAEDRLKPKQKQYEKKSNSLETDDNISARSEISWMAKFSTKRKPEVEKTYLQDKSKRYQRIYKKLKYDDIVVSDDAVSWHSDMGRNHKQTKQSLFSVAELGKTTKASSSETDTNTLRERSQQDNSLVERVCWQETHYVHRNAAFELKSSLMHSEDEETDEEIEEQCADILIPDVPSKCSGEQEKEKERKKILYRKPQYLLPDSPDSYISQNDDTQDRSPDMCLDFESDSVQNYEEHSIDIDIQSGMARLLQSFSSEIQMNLLTRRNQLEQITTEILKAGQQHLHSTWMEEYNHRKRLLKDFIQAINEELQDLEKNIKLLQDAEGKCSIFYKDQQSVITKARSSQYQRIKKLANLEQDFSSRVASDHHAKKLEQSSREMLKKEMQNFQIQLLQKMQQQEFEKIRICLQAIIT